MVNHLHIKDCKPIRIYSKNLYYEVGLSHVTQLLIIYNNLQISRVSACIVRQGNYENIQVLPMYMSKNLIMLGLYLLFCNN